jgi:hypothetical protein
MHYTLIFSLLNSLSIERGAPVTPGSTTLSISIVVAMPLLLPPSYAAGDAAAVNSC